MLPSPVYCLSRFSSFCSDLSLNIHFGSLEFARSNSTSMLHLSKVPIDGPHVTDICKLSYWYYKCTCLFYLLRCIHLKRERQICLKMVGIFVAIHFQIPIYNIIHLYRMYLKTRNFMLYCLSAFLLFHFFFCHSVITLSLSFHFSALACHSSSLVHH